MPRTTRPVIPDFEAIGLTPYYRVTVTIEHADIVSRSPSGQENPQWAPLADHVDLVGGLAARNVKGSFAGQDIEYTRDTHRLQLMGYYPAITEKMRAKVDGVLWNIEQVEADSMKSITELHVWRP